MPNPSQDCKSILINNKIKMAVIALLATITDMTKRSLTLEMAVVAHLTKPISSKITKKEKCKAI